MTDKQQLACNTTQSISKGLGYDAVHFTLHQHHQPSGSVVIVPNAQLPLTVHSVLSLSRKSKHGSSFSSQNFYHNRDSRDVDTAYRIDLPNHVVLLRRS